MADPDENIRYLPEEGWRLPNGELVIPYECEHRRGRLQVGHRDPQFRDWSAIVRRNRHRWKPLHDLHQAAMAGDVDALKEALHSGVAADCVLPTDVDNLTPLCRAARHGREIVSLLVEHGAAVNHQNANGWTPLMSAVWHGNVEVVRLLLERGANPKLANDDGGTALTMVLERQGSVLADATLEEQEEHRQGVESTLRLLMAAQSDSAAVVAGWNEARADDERRWQRSFRRLYHLLEDYEGSRLFEEVLRPYVPGARQTIEELAPFRRMNSERDAYEVSTDHLYQWYALSRVNDFLLMSFQRGHGLDWEGPFHGPDYRQSREHDKIARCKRPDISLDDYLCFFAELGFEISTATPFSPFYHEIVEVVEDPDFGTGSRVEHVFWPGLMFGDLMFSRAGVQIRCSPGAIRKEVAERSPLHFTFWRRRRPTHDLSEGWGHNSQWGTAMRRDYVDGGRFHYNVDGEYYLDETYPDRVREDGWDENDGLSLEERIEVLRHRCFVRADKGDAWPYRDRYSEPVDQLTAVIR
jgi:hypothetical protein